MCSHNPLNATMAFINPLNLLKPQTDPAASAAAQAETERQQQIDAALKSLNDLFASPARQAQYQQYGQDTFNTLKTALDQNEKEAARRLNFGLVRSGNLGGSEDIVQHGLLQRDYSKGLLNASNQAQSASAQLQGADQALKSQIYNMILGGMSATDAAQQAMAGMQTDINAARNLVAPATLDQTFGDLAQHYLHSQAAQGAAAAYANAPSLSYYFGNSPSVSMGSGFNLYDPNYLSYGGGQ